MSLLSRVQLAAAALCSKDEGRYNITHLHVKDKAVEATNGHVLVRVTRTDELDEKEFPNILPDTKQPPEAFIHADIAARTIKALPKHSRIPILDNAQLRQNAENDFIVLGTTDLETPQILTMKPFEGTFPNADAIIPKKEDGKFSIGINPHLLIAVCKYITQFDCGRQPLVEFTFYDSTFPVRVDWKDANHEAIAVVMPMRIYNPKPMPNVETKKDEAA